MFPVFQLMVLLVSTAGAADLDWVETTLVDRTERVLGDSGVGQTLRADEPLFEAYRRALAIAFARPEAFEHVLADAERATPRFYRALRVEGMPEPLVRLLTFAAAHPGKDRIWSLVENTDREEACGRGPLALTYAQGYRLGLRHLQGDALVEREPETRDCRGVRAALRSGSSRRASSGPTPRRPWSTGVAPASGSSTAQRQLGGGWTAERGHLPPDAESGGVRRGRSGHDSRSGSRRALPRRPGGLGRRSRAAGPGRARRLRHPARLRALRPGSRPLMSADEAARRAGAHRL